MITRPTYHRTFMSFAHANRVICAQLAKALETRGVDVWYDVINRQDGFFRGIHYLELQVRSAMLVMISPATLASTWVSMEIKIFQGWMSRYPRHIFLPVRIEDCEVPQFPHALPWIEGVGRPVNDVADDIAQILLLKPI